MFTKTLRPFVYSFLLFNIVYGFFLLLLITLVGCTSTPPVAREALAAAPTKAVPACDIKILKEFGAVKALPLGPGATLIFNAKEEILSIVATELLEQLDPMFKKNGYISDSSFKPVVCSIEGQTVVLQKWKPKAGV